MVVAQQDLPEPDPQHGTALEGCQQGANHWVMSLAPSSTRDPKMLPNQGIYEL